MTVKILTFCLILTHSKRLQRSHTMAVPTASCKSTAPPGHKVTLDTPTYLEVPDFQRVAILGDYASGVTIANNTQNCHHHNFSDLIFLLLCQSTNWSVQVSQLKTDTTAWESGFEGGSDFEFH